MAHTELDLRERRAIEDMLNAKVPVSRIAVEIGRHRSTVYREIRRNRFMDEELPYLNGYYGMVAQRNASERRARRLKLIRLDALRDHVIDRLKEGWTPEQIAGRLGYDAQPVRVSHETIYAYVYSREGQSEELARHLPSRRRKRRPCYTRRPRGQVFPPDRSIHQRGPWRSFEAVEYATLEWMDWFNNCRLLEPIGNIPPTEAEAIFYAALENEDMAA